MEPPEPSDRKYKYFLHAKADSDLETIFDYSVANSGFIKANQYIQEIMVSFERLTINPKLGKQFDPQTRQYSQYRIASHIIFYKPVAKGIEIISVLHKSMLPTRHLGLENTDTTN